MARRLLPIACLALAQGCAIVAGHMRPIWDQSWSRLQYVAPPSMRPAETLRVITRQSDGIPLPGTTVIARDRLGRECAVITDGTGAASFDLAPGDVVIKTLLDGYASHRRLVTVRAEQVCVVEVFSGFTVEDEITVCC